jgi:hypothetical protein
MKKNIAHLEELFVDKCDSHYTPKERKDHNAAIQKAIDAIQMANEVDTAFEMIRISWDAPTPQATSAINTAWEKVRAIIATK